MIKVAARLGNRVKQLYQFVHAFHPLGDHFNSRLYNHVEEFLIVGLSPRYHVSQVGTKAIERYALFPTPALTVLCNRFRFNNL